MESHPLKKRKICVVVNDRAIYGRVKPVMEAIQKHPQLELQVIAVTNFYFDHLFWYLFHGEPVSFLKALSWYIKARTTKILGKSGEVEKLEYLPKLLIGAGFPIHARLPLFLEGGNTRVMVKSAGLGLLGIPKLFEKLKPDIVLIYADRFESLPIAMAAAFLNIPIAHVEGGDVSGTIDESVRHAITKLAHIHFPVTEKSRQRLIRMGENPDFVFMPGFSGIDFIKSIDLGLDDDFFMRYGRGGSDNFDLHKEFLLVLYHPVTTEYDMNYEYARALCSVIDKIGMQAMFVVSNLDAGSDGISSAIREYRGRNSRPDLAFYKNFSPEDFDRVLAHASAAIGNSSSFLREGAFFGTPSVLVGSRQTGRECGPNVIEVLPEEKKIKEAIEKQLRHGRYPADTMFGDGKAGARIAEILARVNPSIQKKFYGQ